VSTKFVQSDFCFSMWSKGCVCVAYVPCSATERLRVPAESVIEGMNIPRTCFEPGHVEGEYGSNESGVEGNAMRWCCAPQSTASLSANSWRGGGDVRCEGADGKRT
jgi:hypothetical protein